MKVTLAVRSLCVKCYDFADRISKYTTMYQHVGIITSILKKMGMFK
jgi:hypothetical protein